MIYTTPYDTTVGKMIDLKQVDKGIKEAMIRDMSHQRTLDVSQIYNTKCAFIVGSGSAEENIPFFSHPVLVNHGAVSILFTDLRPFVRKNEINGLELNSTLPVKNTTEYNFTISRAILSLAWIEGKQSVVKNDLRWAGIVYAMWLSDVISKRYALDPRDQMLIAIVAYYFYYSLFSNDEMSGEEQDKIALHVIKALKTPSPVVYEVFDKAGDLKSMDDLCEAIKRVCDNRRLDDFNPGILLTIISNSWYGLYSREILSVCLEHPPTFCAMVYASVTERTFKNYLISRIAERYGKHGQSDDFVKAYVSLVKDFKNTVGLEELKVLSFDEVTSF